jgi:transcriptional regulator with XRE-family HTH domain
MIQAFGARVKELRESLKADYDDIALFSQITAERLKLIEEGKDKSINAHEIERLAFALGTTYSELFFGKGK